MELKVLIFQANQALDAQILLLCTFSFRILFVSGDTNQFVVPTAPVYGIQCQSTP